MTPTAMHLEFEEKKPSSGKNKGRKKNESCLARKGEGCKKRKISQN